MERKDRLYLDVVKGIAVFLMIWGHCIQYCDITGSFFENPVMKMIYSFHMPLFMLVSGYLFFFSFRKRDLKTLLIHRVQGILQPIIFGTVLTNLLWALMSYALSSADVHLKLINGRLLSGVTDVFWFLWCVLASGVTVAISCKITQKPLLQAVLLIGGIGFVAIFPGMDYQWYMYPYFVFGFLFAEYKGSLAKYVQKFQYWVLPIFPAMLPFYRMEHYIYITPMYSPELGIAGSLKIAAFRYAIGLAGSLFVLVLLDILFRLPERNRTVPKLLTAVSRLGENSLQIYVISVPLLSMYLSVIYDKVTAVLGFPLFGEDPWMLGLLYAPVLSVIYAVGLYMVLMLLKRLGIHSLVFGR